MEKVEAVKDWVKDYTGDVAVKDLEEAEVEKATEADSPESEGVKE